MSIQTNVLQLPGVFDERPQIGVTTRRVDIETELGQLDGNVAVQLALTNLRQDLHVVTSHFIGFRQIGDVLTQLREHRADAVLTQSRRRGEGVLEPFTGHETPDGLADEPQSGAC